MKYLLLIYNDDTLVDALPAGRADAMMRDCFNHADALRGQGALLESQQPGTASDVPGLPAEIDIATTAAYTRRVLAGELPVPPAIARQVEHILQLAHA